MRLFTAITFNDELKDYLAGISDKLKLLTVGGSFTLRDNYHLTLNFIGETERVNEVREVMRRAVKATELGGILLQTGELGRFRRREGDICYISVKKDPVLFMLQRELAGRLKEAGFNVEMAEYKPHLTLSRRTVFADRFDEKLFQNSITGKTMVSERISLMKSERVNGRLTYTEIYGIDLN